jgi:drug/metabolite transporter (DMT)-like permease
VFAVAHEVPVGLSALIPGLQPVLTSILASRFLGERVTPLQWGGVALGLAGVLLILHGRPMTGEAGWGWFASAISLITITVGTLYQKRYCGGIDWRTGSFIQQLAAMVMLGIGAWALETNVIHWSAEFVLSVVWLAVVLSIGTVGLLYWLLRRQASSQVASLFYLVPAVTALMAFVLFGEKLDAVAIIGMIACGAAVLLVNRARA